MTNHRTKRLKRINELDALLARSERLSREEYIDLLHEIRKNYTIKLAVLSVQSKTENTGAIMNVIDKTHWLLDSADPDDAKGKGSSQKVEISFRQAEPTIETLRQWANKLGMKITERENSDVAKDID